MIIMKININVLCYVVSMKDTNKDSHNAVVTCEIESVQKYFSLRRRMREIILFQRVETCLKLLQNLFKRSIAAHECFLTRLMSLKLFWNYFCVYFTCNRGIEPCDRQHRWLIDWLIDGLSSREIVTLLAVDKEVDCNGTTKWRRLPNDSGTDTVVPPTQYSVRSIAYEMCLMKTFKSVNFDAF